MSWFTITPSKDHLQVDRKSRTGSLVLSVQNKSGVPRQVRALIVVDDPLHEGWYTIQEPVQSVRVDETVQFQVDVSLPPEVEPGTYEFQGKVVAEDNPDDVHDSSQKIPVEIPPTEENGGGIPWWIFVIIAAVLVVGGVIVWLLLRDGGDQPTTTTTAPEVTTTSEQTTTTVQSAGVVTFSQLPDGTPVTTDLILDGTEYAELNVLLAGAPQDAYCADATEVAIRRPGTYSGITESFLTTSSPGEINRCNTIPVEIVFIQPVQSLELEFAGASVAYELRAYDQAGSLLGTDQVDAELNAGPFTIDFATGSPTIKRVTFGHQAAVTAVYEIRFQR